MKNLLRLIIVSSPLLLSQCVQKIHGSGQAQPIHTAELANAPATLEVL
jgi:hypothetical protein